MRVLHAPHNIAGHAAYLAAAERAVGVHSRSVILRRERRYQHPADRCLHLQRWPRSWRAPAAAAYFRWALPRTDVFHFNFGQSFVNYPWNHPHAGESGADGRRARDAGKRVFMTWQGCDARQQGYVQGRFSRAACHDPQCYGGMCNLTWDADRARRIAFWAAVAHKQFCLNPDLVRMVPGGEFLPYAVAAPPEPARRHTRTGPIRVVHAPTQREAKGTAHVLRAMETLAHEFPIDFRLVEGLPHAEAVRLYAEADLAIDQVLIGWYGSFAVEVMHLGTPVAAFVRPEDLAYLPRAMAEELPVINVQPDTLVPILRQWLGRREALAELGGRSRAFARRWHDPAALARRLVRVYEDPSQSLYSEEEGRPATGPDAPDDDITWAPAAVDLAPCMRGETV